MALKTMILGASLLAALTGTASAEVWRMQASTASGDLIYNILEEWAGEVATATDGRIEIQWSPINAIVNLTDVMDSVGNGILDGEFSAINIYTGKDKAFAVIGDLVAAYDTPWQVYQFCEYGGGKELLQEIEDPYGVHVIGCIVTGKEAFVSSVPIRGVADLSGVKVRAPAGLASELFSRAGATPVGLPVSEVYGALERGVIEAADAGVYSLNQQLGYHDIAPYPIYPGIHSMPLHQITVSQERWDEMPDDLKAIMEAMTRELQLRLLMRSDIEDARSLKADAEKEGIEVIDWPQEERDAFRAVAQEAWNAYAADSDNARRALDTHFTFMREIGLVD